MSVDGSGAQTTPAFTTAKSGDLLLAFVSSDGQRTGQTSTVTGAGLTWTLVKRANTRPGVSEIWKAQATGHPHRRHRPLRARADRLPPIADTSSRSAAPRVWGHPRRVVPRPARRS